MHSKFLVVLGLCVAVSILTAADAAPRRHLGSTNYGRSNKHGHKHRHDQYPSNYRRRLEDVKAKGIESSDYDYGRHDDYEHKGYDYDYDGYYYKGYGGSYSKGYSGGDCDDYDYKGYGYGYSYSYDYKSYGDDCDDYSDDYYGHGNGYYGFDKGYGYYPDYSYAGGYGGDYGFYPDYYASYGGISGYGYPSYSYYPGYGYSGYGFPGYFGYESTADTKKFDAMTEEGTNGAAEKKDTKSPSKEAKSKSDAVNKSKGK